jgi:uncharacterized protein (DUF2141 family)
MATGAGSVLDRCMADSGRRGTGCGGDPSARVPAPGPVVVQVANVRNTRGRVYVALCPMNQFLAKSCPYEASAPASRRDNGGDRARAPGDWGAQAFQDENGNHEIDRGFSAFPRKAWAFRAMPRS